MCFLAHIFFSRPELVVRFGVLVRLFKDFNKCYRRKETGKIEDVVIDIISKNDLLIDKQASGRDQDLADIVNLKKNSYKGFVR